MRAKQLTKELSGTWHQTYGTACCPAHEDRFPSLSIKDGEGGRLLLKCFGGCDYQEIRGAIQRKLGAGALQTERGCCAITVSRSDASTKAELVSKIWQQTVSIAGTQAERYLRQRGIKSPITPTLRFHPHLRHLTGQRYPALVGRVDDAKRNLVGLHRIYLNEATPTKAKVSPNKAMLGQCCGHAIRQRDGSAGLVVCEGIETGLSLCDGLDNGYAVWAALSTSGMKALHLPKATKFAENLLIACDGDPAGRLAGHVLAERAAAYGWDIELICAPEGIDFNDLAQGMLDE